MKTVNIIGAGRVGRTFLRLFGPRVQDIASATRASADAAVATTGHGQASDLGHLRPADIWILTVPDTQIAIASEALAETAAPAIAIHCSGFHPAEIMAPLRRTGWHVASAHPNLSFADPDAAARRFAGTPCGVEGDDIAVAAIEPILVGLGAKTFRIASDQKALYHAAAVFSNNLATVLQAIARDAWRDAGVPDDIAAALNKSLLDTTAENVAKYGPQDALTGPAARGDTAVVEAQASQVAAWNTEAGAVYRRLSAMAMRLKTTGRIQ
ncbi:MAG: DUF2520 domain-containing protein [Pseudomonadota bacterium]